MIRAKTFLLARWYVIAFFVALVSLSTFFLIIYKTNAVVWTEQAGSVNETWISMDASSTGTKIIASHSSRIYTSNDSGVTWIQRDGAGSRDWISVTSSSDGSKLAAVAFGGYIYTSSDSGDTWTEQAGSGLRDWYGIASSSDGTKLVAVVQDGYIYTSTNSGVSWTEQTASGILLWTAVASSSDGTKLAAIGQSSNTVVYTSNDSGATWTPHSVYVGDCTGSKSITSSSDGTKLAIASCDGGDGENYVYTSSNSGATWTPRTASGSRYWYSISSSDDGAVLLATDIASYPYLSTDSGATWEEQTSAGIRTWVATAVAGNGSVLVAGTFGEKIFTAVLSIDTTAPVVTETTPIFTPANDTTPNYTFTTDEAGTISYGGSCSSATTSAAVGSNTITFNTLVDGTYTNCTVTITGMSLNVSTPLIINSFTIDTTAPVLTETGPINQTFNTTPNFTFNSSEAGNISYGGVCASGTVIAVSGVNTITLNNLAYGAYNNCTITVTDAALNTSNTLLLSSFGVNALGAVAVAVPPSPQVPVQNIPNQNPNPNTNKEVPNQNNTKTDEALNKKCGILPEIPYIMKFRTIHPNVKVLQELLNCKGYLVSKDGPGALGKETNYFGTLTKNAVLSFQKENSLLLKEGVVGPETRGELNK